MADTKIEWATTVWNPLTGCTKVSPGCKHCYAERMAHRLQAMGQPHYVNGFQVTLHPAALETPLRWRKPRRIFVNSMSDLFHPDVPFEFLDRIWWTMAVASQHTFMVLTKRPDHMQAYMADRCASGMMRLGNVGTIVRTLPNVWLGVSIENADYRWRISNLSNTPAALRFLSLEPLLGPLPDLPLKRSGIGWVIVGGESGPKARPMHPDWARGIRDQCLAAGVPFFYKQIGEWIPVDDTPAQYAHFNETRSVGGPCIGRSCVCEGELMVRLGKKRAGRLLDGRTWDEMPDGKEMQQ